MQWPRQRLEMICAASVSIQSFYLWDSDSLWSLYHICSWQRSFFIPAVKLSRLDSYNEKQQGSGSWKPLLVLMEFDSTQFCLTRLYHILHMVLWWNNWGGTHEQCTGFPRSESSSLGSSRRCSLSRTHLVWGRRRIRESTLHVIQYRSHADHWSMWEQLLSFAAHSAEQCTEGGRTLAPCSRKSRQIVQLKKKFAHSQTTEMIF